MKVSCAEEAITKCSRVIEELVDKWSYMYDGYVDKCDLYAQAHLIVCQAYADGVWDKKNPTASILSRLESGLASYCQLEAASAKAEYTSPTMEDVMRNVVLSDTLNEVMATLPERMRQAIALYYLEGYTYSEIMAIMDIPMSRAVTLVQRGLCYMRMPKRAGQLMRFMDM